MHTQPDISYAVGILSRGTQDYGIWYSRSSECKMVGFSDSGWARCTKDRNSTIGMIFNVNIGVVSWGSKKQDSTTLSTTEGEYVAALIASCQAV
ncbi:secreted RxLR effector protein 161-like [Dioscorea cayenensis subsp. rotundata]|uniref:Secreted RxLR effector protein 161-like n=1 Tax=Dioscorea cayennensis subsp. rotundata TaxID=55577 RepID=A0AB40AV47_DIOCR|nr:secreted RxLR effector protein 161-like [Dioscorea cayenensis subsp. rotundata]